MYEDPSGDFSITKWGTDKVSSPSSNNPNHATLSGITADKAESFLLLYAQIRQRRNIYSMQKNPAVASKKRLQDFLFVN